MDAASTIATGIALAAAASAGTTALNEAVKDGYAKLKSAMRRDHPEYEIPSLDSPGEAAALKGRIEEFLSRCEGDQSSDLLQAAYDTIAAVTKSMPQTLDLLGVHLRHLEGTNLSIDNVTAAGTGVYIEHSSFRGDVIIKGIRAGVRSTDGQGTE